MFSLPRVIAPAFFKFCVTVLSYSGLKPSRILLAAWVKTPLQAKRSFTPIGMPQSAGASPCFKRKSADFA